MEASAEVTVTGMRLGKRAPKFDRRTLRMAKYIDPSMFSALPTSIDWRAKAQLPWDMLGNDKYGDCTCAALGHCEQVWTANAGTEKEVTTEQVVEFATYCDALEGANMLDVLNKYRARGIAGDQALAFAAFDTTPEFLRYAIAMFGAAYIGVSLPVLAQSQDIWDYVDHANGNEIGSWGGHAISLHAYEPGRYGLVTWGAPKWMTEAFFTKYCDEAYVVLSQDWIDAQGKSPSGFDIDALRADLGALGL
jgi:hypothetical protein